MTIDQHLALGLMVGMLVAGAVLGTALRDIYFGWRAWRAHARPDLKSTADSTGPARADLKSTADSTGPGPARPASEPPIHWDSQSTIELSEDGHAELQRLLDESLKP